MVTSYSYLGIVWYIIRWLQIMHWLALEKHLEVHCQQSER
jgi:hypothetical protein